MVKKSDHFFLTTMLIQTFLSLFIFFILFQHYYLTYSPYVYAPMTFYFNLTWIIPLCILIIVFIIQWRVILIQDKKTKPLNQWLLSFINRYQNEYLEFKQDNHFLHYTKKLSIVTAIYVFCLNLSAITVLYFIIKNQSSSFPPLIIFICIIIILFTFYFRIVNKLNRQHYFYYMNSSQPLFYIFMSYDLSNVKYGRGYFIRTNDYLNVSAALGRLLLFQEGYDYIQLWRHSFTRLTPLYRFVYIEHCTSFLAMLKRHEEVQLVYQDYQILYNKYKRLRNNIIIRQMTYLVSLYYAYDKEDWTKIIELEKEYTYTNQIPLDNCIYIFYQAHLHTNDHQADIYLNKYPNNLFFKNNI